MLLWIAEVLSPDEDDDDDGIEVVGRSTAW